MACRYTYLTLKHNSLDLSWPAKKSLKQDGGSITPCIQLDHPTLLTKQTWLLKIMKKTIKSGSQFSSTTNNEKQHPTAQSAFFESIFGSQKHHFFS